MLRISLRLLLATALTTALTTTAARAQSDSSTNTSELLGVPPSPSLGIAPGVLDPPPFDVGPGIIGGQMRRGVGRLPRRRAGGTPGSGAPAARGGMDLPALPILPDALADPDAGDTPVTATDALSADDEGPANGLTLDAAIARLLAANLDLAALRLELPQADADILTASLRANPILFVDNQMIPYGSYSDARPGGPVQYDIGLTVPLDVTHKRQARVRVARVARRALEAQYQDAARRQIGDLGRAFVTLQESWITLRDAAVLVQEAEADLATAAPADREALQTELDEAMVARDEAIDDLADARDTMALLLNLPAESAPGLVPRGPIRGLAPPPPPLEELQRVALDTRPDLIAARIGIARAQHECGLARAGRMDDWYLFYNPWTYQDERPFKVASASSWSVGLTVPLPVSNRNQGNIQRARINIAQAQTEQQALERRVATEVRLAHRELTSARAAVARLERTIRTARPPRPDETKDQETVQKRQTDLRTALIRQRRSQLDLNTAVGMRLIP